MRRCASHTSCLSACLQSLPPRHHATTALTCSRIHMSCRAHRPHKATGTAGGAPPLSRHAHIYNETAREPTTTTKGKYVCPSKTTQQDARSSHISSCKGSQAQKAKEGGTKLSGIKAEPQMSSLTLTPPPRGGAKGHVVSNLKNNQKKECGAPSHGKARRAKEQMPKNSKVKKGTNKVWKRAETRVVMAARGEPANTPNPQNKTSNEREAK